MEGEDQPDKQQPRNGLLVQELELRLPVDDREGRSINDAKSIRYAAITTGGASLQRMNIEANDTLRTATATPK